MYDTNLYKTVAKKQLEKRWTVPVLATLVCCAILIILEGATNISSAVTGDEARNLQGQQLALTLFCLCIEGILDIANANIYVRLSLSKEPFSFSQFIDGFSLWSRGLLLSLWQTLWIFLWSLLFVIPGIIKAIAYSLAMYVLAENPKIGIRKALRLSIIMTAGHKTEMFFTFVSFLPWVILCFLTFGVGFFWLVPYMKMTWVNVFHALKLQALNSGILQVSDFQ